MPAMKSYDISVTMTVTVRESDAGAAMEEGLRQISEAFLGRQSPMLRSKFESTCKNISIQKVDK